MLLNSENGPELRRVRINPEGKTMVVELDGVDISRDVSAYAVQQVAGEPAHVVLHLSAQAGMAVDGLAHVEVGLPPDPGPAAAQFLSSLDGRELERVVLARHDLLDGRPHELGRGMLRLLTEWARGEWAGWESTDAFATEPTPQCTP
ncbi:hypothetical protein ACIBCO_28805 [Streptomyces violascens]|uniref:hypothetical protein n=1 Tax=Streptomyces violascens TaxID=67381 RepID=UPI0037A17D20